MNIVPAGFPFTAKSIKITGRLTTSEGSIICNIQYFAILDLDNIMKGKNDSQGFVLTLQNLAKLHFCVI